MKRTADLIFEMLKPHTDVVFMLPGGGACFLVDALGQSGIPYVPMLHEQGAGMAACGYAGISGKLGVCLVTSGPGATNAITACAAAWCDSFPVLFISGQTSFSTFNPKVRTSGVQSVNITPMLQGQITKMAWMPVNSDESIKCVHKMIRLCLEARQGPCWLDIPMDVQGEVMDV